MIKSGILLEKHLFYMTTGAGTAAEEPRRTLEVPPLVGTISL